MNVTYCYEDTTAPDKDSLWFPYGDFLMVVDGYGNRQMMFKGTNLLKRYM